jgi:hypothetical protein
MKNGFGSRNAEGEKMDPVFLAFGDENEFLGVFTSMEPLESFIGEYFRGNGKYCREVTVKRTFMDRPYDPAINRVEMVFRPKKPETVEELDLDLDSGITVRPR